MTRQPKTQHTRATVTKDRRIGLLLEDNPDHAQLLLALLERERPTFTMKWVSTVAQAMHTASEQEIALVIADMFLDKEPIGPIIGQLREAAGHAWIIILSGSDDATLGADAIKRGADEYLVKDRKTLQKFPKLLDRWLQKSRKASARTGRGKGAAGPVDALTGTLFRELEQLGNKAAPLPATKKKRVQRELQKILTQVKQIGKSLE